MRRKVYCFVLAISLLSGCGTSLYAQEPAPSCQYEIDEEGRILADFGQMKAFADGRTRHYQISGWTFILPDMGPNQLDQMIKQHPRQWYEIWLSDEKKDPNPDSLHLAGKLYKMNKPATTAENPVFQVHTGQYSHDFFKIEVWSECGYAAASSFTNSSIVILIKGKPIT